MINIVYHHSTSVAMMETVLPGDARKIAAMLDANTPFVIDSIPIVDLPDTSDVTPVKVFVGDEALFLIPDTSIPVVKSDPFTPKRIDLKWSELRAPPPLGTAVSPADEGAGNPEGGYRLCYSEEAVETPALRCLLGRKPTDPPAESRKSDYVAFRFW
jgi:hypothetical protein